MTFWTGFCLGAASGVTVAFLICLVGLSAMSWTVAKDRKAGSGAQAQQDELHRNLQGYWQSANKWQKMQVKVLDAILCEMTVKEPVELTAGDEVMVYDKYRFSIPLLGMVTEFGDGDIVSVKLRESNNASYPIGKDVWLSRQQIVPTKVDGD